MRAASFGVAPAGYDLDHPGEARLLEILGLKAAQVCLHQGVRNGGREFQPVVGVIKDALAHLHGEPLADPRRIGLMQMFNGRQDVVALRVPHVLATKRRECALHDAVQSGLARLKSG